MIGWIALAASGLVIVASLFVGNKAATASLPSVDGTANHHPIHAWLEIAWPVFFIAVMGMLTLKEIFGFPAVLLLATVLTGTLWAIDSFALRKKRPANTADRNGAQFFSGHPYRIRIAFFLVRTIQDSV